MRHHRFQLRKIKAGLLSILLSASALLMTPSYQGQALGRGSLETCSQEDLACLAQAACAMWRVQTQYNCTPEALAKSGLTPEACADKLNDAANLCTELSSQAKKH